MLNVFKRQTPENIFRFLSRMGQQTDVYSAHPESLCPTLEDKCVYVYVNEEELAIVMIDEVLEGTKEKADLEFSNPLQETLFHNVTTHYQSGSDEKRVSPIWQLFHAAMSLRELINKDLERPLQIHAMLITNSHIVNVADLRWTANLLDAGIGMTILHDCQTFFNQWSVLRLPVNQDFFLVGSSYIESYKRELAEKRRREKEEQDDDEFSRLFREFLEDDDDNDSDEDDIDDIDDDDNDDDSSTDDIQLDAAAADFKTRLAACRSSEERKLLLIRYAKRKVAQAGMN